MPSLQRFHTFGLQSSCEALHIFDSSDAFLDAHSRYALTYLVGEGSNTLFLKDFAGAVLVNRMKGLVHKETRDAHIIEVQAGENWHEFVQYCLEQGWYGLENLALIPGAVGASPIQNIGAYGVEAGDFITSVTYTHIESGEIKTLSHAECEFGYRDSIFKRELSGKILITQVTFTLPKTYSPVVTYGELAALQNPTAQAVFDKVIAVRQAKLPDPAVLGNAGSFFKNPEISVGQYNALKAKYPDMPGFDVSDAVKKVPAAWLIDKLGFKGKCVNAVRCHPTQPLVLTNTGQADGEDILTLARDIIGSIQETFSIALEPEVRLIGEQGLISL